VRQATSGDFSFSVDPNQSQPFLRQRYHLDTIMIRFLSSVSLAFALAVVAACHKAPGPSNNEPRRYDVKGIVRGIGFAEREMTVEHEEIPGFMPAMTMPFAVKEMKEVEKLSAGDAIRFQLVVTERDSWITDIRPVPRSEVRIAGNTTPTNRTAVKSSRLHEGDPLPEFHLVDEQNQPIAHQTFAGAPTVLTFLFTRCPIPNFCPLMSKNFAALREIIGRDPKLSRTQLLSISFDPAYDTPAQLAQYAAMHRPPNVDPAAWRFATGTPEEIARLTAAFAVNVKAESGTFNHGLATVLVDANGVIRKIWRGNGWQPDEVVAELAKL
jgi:protein SCO1/2